MNTPLDKGNSQLILIILAFFIVYFVWGSTYLANWWAVRAVEPFLLAGARFFLAGALMYLLSMLIGRSGATRRQWKNAFFSGFMLFLMGNGLLVWAMQYMDSGITALVIAFEPLVVVVLLWLMRGQRPKKVTLTGILFGVVGMSLLVGQEEYLQNQDWMFALLLIFISILAWAYISVWLPTADLPSNAFLSASMQMLCGGACLLIVAVFTGDYQEFNPDLLTGKVIWSFVYLILGGSIAAFTAFNFLLKTVSPEKVVTNAYINPIVALFLGWGLNGEQISMQSFWASVVLITGVVIIISRKRRRGS